jgi:hypothetical protein
MKKNIPAFILLIMVVSAKGQERLFSIGAVKNYISKDSTNFSFNLDLNRIPGAAEKAGGYYFYNDVIGSSRFGLYIKPTADVNIGTGTTTAPNNISIGIPIGIVYDFKNLKLLSWYAEINPEGVADKSFDNYLFYGNAASYLKFEYNKKMLLNIISGASVSTGKRSYSAKVKGTHAYGRFTWPSYIKLNLWEDSAGKKGQRQAFSRINTTTTFKFSNVYRDERTITPDPTLNYFSFKFDFYFIPRLALSLVYNNGYEEPLFKKVKSLTVGVTLARF